jgi:hypothetical protein
MWKKRRRERNKKKKLVNKKTEVDAFSSGLVLKTVTETGAVGTVNYCEVDEQLLKRKKTVIKRDG